MLLGCHSHPVLPHHPAAEAVTVHSCAGDHGLVHFSSVVMSTSKKKQDTRQALAGITFSGAAFFNINSGQVGVDYFSETRPGETEKTIKQRRIERMQETWIQTRYEAKMRSRQRMKEHRDFRRQYLADMAGAYRVPDTRLGKYMIRRFTPRLLSKSHNLVWLELWTQKRYNQSMYESNELARTKEWI